MYRILLIEDNEFIREIYNHVFTKRGHTIIEAEDGELGIEAAKKDNYDLILLDILMPKMNGIDVLKVLKAPRAKTRNIPILLLSNLGQEEIIRQAYKIGANGFLLKADLLPREVVRKVEDFMSGKIKTEDFLPSQSTE